MSAPLRTFAEEISREPLEGLRSSERFSLRCPECGGSAFAAGCDLFCPSEGRCFPGEDGILSLMRTERLRELAAFVRAYRSVRRSEGWGGGAEYYRGLPFDSGGRHRAVWKLRARSYRAALRAIERRYPRAKRVDECDRVALSILEVGAGNGWFSWRMAERGHYALATDVSLDAEDGLGAVARYALPTRALRERLTLARAEMEELPLESAELDLVVANAALHYAKSVCRAVSEAHRVLRAGGLFLVLDSPVYDDESPGREMVERREREQWARYGVRSPRVGSGFLVEKELVSILESAGFRVDTILPFEGMRRRARRVSCSLRGSSPPARFPLFAAEKR